MGVLFELNGKELELAAAEAKAFVYGWGWWKHNAILPDGQLLYLPRERVREHKFTTSKLGLTHRIVKVLATCETKDLAKTLGAIPWRTHVKKKSYRVNLSSYGTVRATSASLSERDAARIIWTNAGSNVDLKTPNTIIDIFVTQSKAYIGLRFWTQNESFEQRRSHLLPASHPSMMHPAMSRAIAHLVCSKKMHDPFCGTGGLVLEANLAGIHMSGADIESEMLKRCRYNCNAYGVRPSLRLADASTWIPRVQGIATDMPYGKNTKPVALQQLFEAFLTRATQSTNRIVVGLPTAMNMPKGWTLRAHLTSYVHKSMTKHFYVLERV